MLRKVFKTGPATLTISLPAKWTKIQNIKKGDNIDIQEFDGGLIIQGSHSIKKPIKKLKLKFEDYPDQTLFEAFLIGSYYYGYDEIEIEYSNKQVFEFIQKIVDKALLGFEMVDQKEGSFTLKEIAPVSEERYDEILKQAFVKIHEMFDIIESDLKSNSFTNEFLIEKLRFDVLKYSNYCRRVLNKKQNDIDLVVLNNFSVVSRELWRGYNFIKDIKKVNKKVVGLFSKLRQMYETFQSFYPCPSMEKYKQLSLISKTLYFEDIVAYLNENKGQENSFVLTLGIITRELRWCIMPTYFKRLKETNV